LSAGISITSTGKNLLAAELDANKFHVTKRNGTWCLVFEVDFKLQAKLIDWDVNSVTASGACKQKILGIEIYNVCGWVGNKLKDVLDPLEKKVIDVNVPKVLKRIQDKVNALIGDEVVIPLKL